MLLALVEQNENNRMAFEYLMAHYLLNVQPEKLAAQVGRLADFDYGDIPLLYAEAVALHAHDLAQPAVACGRPLPAEAVQQAGRAGLRRLPATPTATAKNSPRHWLRNFPPASGHCSSPVSPEIRNEPFPSLDAMASHRRGHRGHRGGGLLVLRSPAGLASDTSKRGDVRGWIPYHDCTIPPNIAPLDFQVKEEGSQICVRVGSESGRELIVANGGLGVVFAQQKWQALIDGSRGQSLSMDVYVRRSNSQWRHFDTISPLRRPGGDRPLRRLPAAQTVAQHVHELGTYQRRLDRHEESPILLEPARVWPVCDEIAMRLPITSLIACCCTFAAAGHRHAAGPRRGRNPGRHADGACRCRPPIRLAPQRAIGGVLRQQPACCWTTRWAIAAMFSTMARVWAFTTSPQLPVLTVPQIADPNTWRRFPPGRRMASTYISARALSSWPAEAGKRNILPTGFDRIRYDLCRIAYDDDHASWGNGGNIAGREGHGMSMSEPRVSPNGRWLLFCMHQYGSFPVYQASSDLHMMALETRRHWRLGINSDRSDSWHCWSSNGRWIVFASKRRDGLFGRLYFSYIEANGEARSLSCCRSRTRPFTRAFWRTSTPRN